MEIAYLVLAHEKPHQLARLLQALGTEGARIFVHVDLAASLEAFVANCAYIRNVEWARHRVDVRWGGFGVVQATLNLMSQALETGRYDYLLLLSGADYPIVSNARIVAELDSGNGSEFINCTPMPAPKVGKPMSRLDRYFFAPKNRRNVFARLLNRALRIGPRRNPSRALGHMQPYGGSGWWCLSSACATYVLEFVQENPAFVRFFRRTRIPTRCSFRQSSPILGLPGTSGRPCSMRTGAARLPVPGGPGQHRPAPTARFRQALCQEIRHRWRPRRLRPNRSRASLSRRPGPPTRGSLSMASHVVNCVRFMRAIGPLTESAHIFQPASVSQRDRSSGFADG